MKHNGIEDDGPAGLAALRALPADKLLDGASAREVLDGMPATKRWCRSSLGANDRDLGIGRAETKDDLFALFGNLAAEARALYDPTGNETLEELKQQVLADKTLVEPSRHLADEMVHAGQPAWWYRFSYVAESLRDDPKWKGAMHGFEIPYVFDIPAAHVGDKVTDADKAMAARARRPSQLFLDVTTKTRPGTNVTFLLPHFGHCGFTASCSEIVSVRSNLFPHFSQRY